MDLFSVLVNKSIQQLVSRQFSAFSKFFFFFIFFFFACLY